MIGPSSTPEPIVDFAETPDRWRLATYRYARTQSKRPPVLLVHGLGTNRFDVDFPDPHLSLAQFLYHQGYDTWVVELRGSGRSRKIGILSHLRATTSPDWTFDDHIFTDLPTVASFIRKKTGRKKFHWIGHSLGGTLIYGAIGVLGDGVCASAVTLGAAISSHAKPGVIKFLLKMDPLMKLSPLIPLKPLARVAAKAARTLAPLEDNFCYAIDNIDLETIELALKTAVENISMRLFLQLHEWYKKNHFYSREKKLSYRDLLKKIGAPFLVAAGSVDGLTPSLDIHFAFKQLGSKDKKYVVFGRESGCRTEYGHIDLVLGKNAPREVYPVIADWLRAHDSLAPAKTTVVKVRGRVGDHR